MKNEKFINQKENISQETYHHNLKIIKLKADNSLLQLEIESCRNELKLQKFKNNMILNSELLIRKNELILILKDKARELIKKQFIQLEINKELKSLKNVNETLTSYLALLKKSPENNQELTQGWKNYFIEDKIKSIDPKLKHHKRAHSWDVT